MATQSSNQSSSSVPSIESSAPHSNKAKTDPAWKYCTEVLTEDGKIYLKCMFCSKVLKGGGIHRLKFHVAGLFGAGCTKCLKSTDEARRELTESVQNAKAAESSKSRSTTNNSVVEEQNGDGEEFVPSKKRPADSSNPLGSFFVPRTTPGSQPSIKSVWQGQEVKEAVDFIIAKWFYDAAIPFNATNSVFYQPVIDAIASYGKGYKGPNVHALRGKLLKKTMDEVNNDLVKHRAAWKQTGCTIMADGWTDQNGRSLINFLAYSTKGTFFLNSTDASSASKTAPTLFVLFRQIILFIGAENIVPVVTDNAANYKAAGGLIEKAYPTISWSPCAAHCLNLMFSDIGKLDRVKSTVDHASKITKYIYNHCYVLNLMRTFTNGRNLLRPAPTRFATNFVALQSILSHNDNLVAMVSSLEWKRSKFSKEAKGKDFVKKVFHQSFWKECELIVSITELLVQVLRLVDTDDRPAMGYLYAAIIMQEKR